MCCHVYCRNKGIFFVAIDLNKPMLEQGPFDVVLHKVCEISFVVFSLSSMDKIHHVCVFFLLSIYGYAAFVAGGLTFLRAIVSMLSVSHYLTFLFVIPSCQERSGVRLSRFVNSEYLHLHPLSDCTRNHVLLF